MSHVSSPVPAVVATAAAAGVGGVGMVWWCGDDTGAQHSKIY